MDITFLILWKALKLTFFEQGQTCKAVNLDLGFFIEGAMFQKVHNNIKGVVV